MGAEEGIESNKNTFFMIECVNVLFCMAKYILPICSVLTLIFLPLYMVDPLHTGLHNRHNTNGILLLYALVGLVYFIKKSLFYPSINVLLLGLIVYYLIVGYFSN